MENFNVLTPWEDIQEALASIGEICILTEIQYYIIKESLDNGSES